MDNNKRVSSNLGILVICLFSAVLVILGFIFVDDSLNGLYVDDVDYNVSGLKIDGSKDFVYDASYSSGFSVEKYSANDDVYYLKDIVVPYFNINSVDASRVNDDVSYIYSNLVDVYERGVNGEGIGDSVYFIKDCGYKSIIFDNVSSTIFTYSYGVTNAQVPTYLTYNFDLTDGHLLSYQDICNKLGYSDIDSMVLSVIRSYYNDYNSSSFDVELAIQNSYSNYLSSVSEGTVRYFIDGNNLLNVVVSMNVEGLYDYVDVVLVIDSM